MRFLCLIISLLSMNGLYQVFLFTTLHPGSKTTKFNTVVLTLIVKTVLDVNMTQVHIYKPNDVLEADHLIIGSQGLSSSLLSQ